MKVVSVVGARPQFVKEAALGRELRKVCEEVVVHTGQHYDDGMSQIFFRELGIPRPEYSLGIGPGSAEEQGKKIIEKLSGILGKEKPSLVIVYGDTTSTLAAAKCAREMGIAIGHVEAGMRCFDMSVPEEYNRVETDKISDILFCPTESSVGNLEKEGITEGVKLTGDVMADNWGEVAALAEKKAERPSLESYVLATIHRQENADSREAMERIVSALAECGKQILLPLHPRTEKNLGEFGLRKKIESAENVKITKPLGYLEFILAEKNSEKIVTDSGGVQKEAYFFGKPCITLREKTEWAETIEEGWNVLVGSNKKEIVDAITGFEPKGERKKIFGEGASKKIAEEIRKYGE